MSNIVWKSMKIYEHDKHIWNSYKYIQIYTIYEHHENLYKSMQTHEHHEPLKHNMYGLQPQLWKSIQLCENM